MEWYVVSLAWNYSHLPSLVCWYSRWMIADDGCWFEIQSLGGNTTINRLPQREPQWTWIARARWAWTAKFVGRLSSSLSKPKLNRQTKYSAIQMMSNNQPAGNEGKQSNNQPAEGKGKEQIDRRCEKRNYDFKILGNCSDGTKSETWSVGHRFGSVVVTNPSTIVASWCLVVAQPKGWVW